MAAVTQLQLSVRPFSSVARRTAGNASRRVVRLVVKAQSERVEKKATVTELSALVRPAAAAVLSNIIMALPAHAEAGKIFDFNLTLPVMAGQFLLLMVFLDKTWFGPVGKLLDERDSTLRSKLGSVKDNASTIDALQEEAAKIVAEARAEAQKAIQKAKSETQAEQNAKIAALKAKIDKELEVALATLDSEKEAALKGLDAQVDKLSAEILSRILPEGVKL